MSTPSKAALPLLLIALYALSILLANLTLNTFIPLPVYGLLSVGTIFFAAVFTLRDRIHRAGGLNAVYIAIAAALIVNTVVALLTGTPWRFVGASFLAILAGELADTAVYQRLMGRSWWTRVLASNAAVNVFHCGFVACDRYAQGEEAMAALTCPVLMVLGDEDQMTQPKAAQTLIAQARASGKTLQVMRLPVGHHQMSEAPEATLQALRAFLQP